MTEYSIEDIMDASKKLLNGKKVEEPLLKLIDKNIIQQYEKIIKKQNNTKEDNTSSKKGYKPSKK
jgi:hypothetical protein